MNCKLWEIRYYDSGWKTIHRGWSCMPEKTDDESSNKLISKWVDGLLSVTDIPKGSIIIIR